MITTTTDERLDLTLYTCTGQLELEEVKEAIARFYAGQPTTHMLWDVSRAKAPDVGVEEIRQLADRVKRLAHSRSGGKTAIVAPADLIYGFGRMYQVFAEMADQMTLVAVFRSLPEAKAWLRGEATT